MTIEEAIFVLEDGGWWDFLNLPCDDLWHKKFHDSLDMAISALRVQQEAEKNEPLTLEELREMHGEPVWRVQSGHDGRWALVKVFWKAKDVVYLVYVHGGSEQADIALSEGVKLYRRRLCTF